MALFEQGGDSLNADRAPAKWCKKAAASHTPPPPNTAPRNIQLAVYLTACARRSLHVSGRQRALHTVHQILTQAPALASFPPVLTSAFLLHRSRKASVAILCCWKRRHMTNCLHVSAVSKTCIYLRLRFVLKGSICVQKAENALEG